MKQELAAAKNRILQSVPQGSRLLCAVSGGMDSMCLLHLLADWGEKQGFLCCAAHFNHQIRGEDADQDEALVRRACQGWSVPLYVGRGDVCAAAAEGGRSLEEAARDLRYAFLSETAERTGCTAILTAHHSQDNAETMLLNLIRGTGIKGLCGIPPQREGVVRIFLDTPRAELAAYAQGHHLPYREDETNFDPDAAARNFLRLRILPLLLELNPKVVEHLNATAKELRALEELIEAEVRQVCGLAVKEGGGLRLPLSVLHGLSPPLLGRVFLGLVQDLGAGRKDWGRVHLEALAELVRRGSGQLDLPGQMTACCKAGAFLLRPRGERLPRTPLQLDRPCSWGPYLLTLRVLPEGKGLQIPLGPEGRVEVGPCPPSARLQVSGSRGGRRTVKRLCQDRGIPPMERDTLPAIYADDVLVAVWRLGVDEASLLKAPPLRFLEIQER